MLAPHGNEDWFQGVGAPYPGGGGGQPAVASYAVDLPAPLLSPPPAAAGSGPFDPSGGGLGGPGARGAAGAPGTLFAGLTSQMREHAMSYVANEAMTMTRTRAAGISRFLSVDWLVDWLQPYFAVDAPTVLRRMRGGVLPKSQDFAIQEPDLYGPTMLAFTVTLVLRVSLNVAQVTKGGDSTAMGTALGVCFGYWLGTAGLLFLASYASDTRLSVPSMLCLIGYSLTADLIILPLGCLASWLFYGLFLTVGLAAAAAVALTVRKATPDVKRGAPTAALCGGAHLLYLLYLKWSYLS